MPSTTTGTYIDQTTYEVSFSKFNEKKKYKEDIVKEIIAGICAMLNSNGGKVVINIDAGSNDISLSQISLVVRIVEQKLIDIIGTNITQNVNFEDETTTVTIFVEKADSLITVNYHLYLPSTTQVVPVPPSESREKVKDDIVNRKVIHAAVQFESHKKAFLKGKKCDLSEAKTVQLKNLKAGTSNCRTLADRMTCQSNKLTYYVSSFANYNGGHIYYGIDDDGVVVGESIPDELELEITKKVEKSINKMIWPEQPKRNVHWEIFFEPVFDDNSSPIPSTFVIVIYIAPCLGGVFTEKPECYEIVKGKVAKMSFTTWKSRILQPIELFHPPIIYPIGKRTKWGSSRIQKVCSLADELLVTTINNGKSIQVISNNLVKTNPDLIEVRLLILAKNVMASYRSFSFKEARDYLDEYEKSLRTATEFWMFDAIRVYLEAAISTVQGDVKAVRNILPNALDQAKNITPGRISAAIYLLAGMNLLQQKGDDDHSSVLFFTRALEHIKDVQDTYTPKIRADMEHKAQILLALLYLGCNTAGVPTKNLIDSECLEKVRSSIMAVEQSIREGHKMNPYRQVQFCLVQSIFLYRKSQLEPDKKLAFVSEALEFCEKAKERADECDFKDTVKWSKDRVSLFTQDLLRSLSH